MKLIFHYQVRQKRITFLFISSNGREQLRDESKNNWFFSLLKEKKIGKNGRWEQFVRNSRHRHIK